MVVVSNSSPIIALARVSKLHLLRDLFGEVLIPNGVYLELVKKGKAGAEEVERGLFIKREHVKNQGAVERMLGPLTQADAEVIVLAKEKKAGLVLIDEGRLTKQAEEADTAFMTARGILLEAKSQGIITSVKEIMNEMRRQGIGIPADIYEYTLRQAGEK